ncbi:MAG: hypothetical protein RIB80_06090 [Rhodospirillales bacterium]
MSLKFSFLLMIALAFAALILWVIVNVTYTEIAEKDNWLPLSLITFFLASLPVLRKFSKTIQEQILSGTLFAAGLLVLGILFDDKEIVGIGFGVILICFPILEIPHLTNKLKAGSMGVVSIIALWGYIETEVLNYVSLTALTALCATVSLFRDRLTTPYFQNIGEDKRVGFLIVALVLSLAVVKIFRPIP